MAKAKKINLGSEISGMLSNFLVKKLPRVSLIIPALNEEKRIAKVIIQAQKVPEIKEIVVVDDGSRDKTAKIAEELGTEVIKHHKNLGKGEALKTGISHSKGDILLFLDADLMNIEPKKIRALILPILKDKADFTKAIFTRARGRVTEFAVKPMMQVLYPENHKFKQPISGQFAGRKNFLEKIQIEPRWGIDISIFLDAIKQGQRVLEVNIGELIHKKSPDSEVAKMSSEVMETMLKKSGLLFSKHKILFLSDKTTFFNGFSEGSELFLKKLKEKKMKIVLITTKEPKTKYMEYFNCIKKVGPKSSPREIYNFAKKIAKKYDATLKDSVVIANRTGFDKLAEKTDMAFCFNHSPFLLKEKCKEITSLSEVLVFLE
jgi:glycosyltransferase involved in cell wall biosynthesis